MSTDIEGNDLNNIENRLRTFTNWPVRFIDKRELARAGFYYLNNSDQVKCIECGGVIGRWEEGDIPFIEHKKFFPDCPIVRQNDLNEDIGIQPVEIPKYPEYSTIESRNRSFFSWTSTAQDPSVLSQAGFFYLNAGDEVRCFYCDVGLRNWLVGDDPWVEHARWCPKCPFVILVKGTRFVKEILERTQNSSNQGLTPSGPSEQMTIDDAMNSQPAQDALQMGLNAGRVRLIMQRRLQLKGKPFTSTEALVAAVLDGQIDDEGYEHESETEGQIESQVTELLLSAVSSVAFNSSTDDTEQASTSSNVNVLRPSVPDDNIVNRKQPSKSPKLPTAPDGEEMDEKRLKNVECKICMAEEMGVVFLPCGHLLSCVFCAPAISQCPLCRETIRGRVRTFLS